MSSFLTQASGQGGTPPHRVAPIYLENKHYHLPRFTMLPTITYEYELPSVPIIHDQ